MKRILFAVLAAAVLSGCVVMPPPGHAIASSVQPYPGEAWPYSDYPHYYSSGYLGLYFGWPYGYAAPGYRHYGPGWGWRSHRHGSRRGPR